jgi:AcrR family transcriptional regulator
MTPRPRTVSDEAILRATAEVIGRLGPNRMTLADVGAEVGLSAAALVQRFGSKRNLLLSLATAGPGEQVDAFAAARTSASPMGALVDLMGCMGRMARTPEEMANHLAFLQMDLSDPDFFRSAKAHFEATIAGTRELLEAAKARGELSETDTEKLARAVYSVTSGALLNWAIHREGTAEQAIRSDLEVLLAPYRSKQAVEGSGG